MSLSYLLYVFHSPFIPCRFPFSSLFPFPFSSVFPPLSPPSHLPGEHFASLTCAFPSCAFLLSSLCLPSPFHTLSLFLIFAFSTALFFTFFPFPAAASRINETLLLCFSLAFLTSPFLFLYLFTYPFLRLFYSPFLSAFLPFHTATTRITCALVTHALLLASLRVPFSFYTLTLAPFLRPFLPFSVFLPFPSGND